MSLRSSKVVLKSGIKNLSSGRFYTTAVKDERIVFVSAGPSQRPSNELLATNPQFPFQGGIGLDISRISVQAPIKLQKKVEPTFKSLSKETTSDGRLRKRISELPDLIDTQMRMPELGPDYTPESEKVKIEVLKAERDMELKATSCPKLLKKELKTLFLDVEFGREKNFTVLNLTQKSATDMSAWSPEMEVEREKLTKDFINIAISICSDLQKLGNGKYWADFIEPSSGRPYFGKYTNASLFETNDSYRELGFQIEDLGCCKVLKHVKWATHAFVGTIFTDAPMNSPEVKTILMNSQAGQYFQEKSESEQII